MYYVILFIFFHSISIYSQYSSFDLLPTHTIGAGMAVEGVGIRDTVLNLSSNPAFLAGKNEKVIDGGGVVPFQGTQSSSLRPSHFGGYYPLNEVSGIGVRGRTVFQSSFPTDSRFTYLQTHIFYSRVFYESIYISIGLGPGVGLRGQEQSNLSVSPYLSLGYVIGKITMGFSVQSPGGNYNYKLYRNGDYLKERLPPTVILGISYNVSQNLQFYSELKRVLYEKSSFTLNDEENKPKFDRGFGAELKAAFGMSLAIREESVWKIRTGIELGGKYDETGKNRRGTGLGFGLGYSPNPDEKGFQFNFSVLDYSLLSNKNGYPSETLFFAGLGYLY